MDSEKDEKEGGGKGGFGGDSRAPGGAGNRTLAGAMFLALFLIVGGLISWFSMKNAAHDLAGADKYAQLTSNNAAAPGSAAAVAARQQGFFASEEELAKADPSFKKELQDSAAEAAGLLVNGGTAGAPAAAGGGPGSSNGSGGEAGAASRGAYGGVAAAGASGPGSLPKMLARGFGAARPGEGQGSNSTISRSDERETGAAPVVIRSDAGRPAGGPGKASKTSVMDALKSAFKGNVYGARLASKDAAREWTARAFHASPESQYSLAYPEEMKAKLDRMNPGSIPKYLREQNLDASDARTLGVSEVGKPEFDKEGTKAALDGDKNYQEKKVSGELAKALFNPLGPFGGGGDDKPASDPGSPAGPQDDSSPPGDDRGRIYNNPEAEIELKNLALGDVMEGYGAECGCTEAAPCCCLPPGTFDQNCPKYGPFLPDDPCGALMYDNPAGDFPQPADGAAEWI